MRWSLYCGCSAGICLLQSGFGLLLIAMYLVAECMAHDEESREWDQFERGKISGKRFTRVALMLIFLGIMFGFLASRMDGDYG